MGYYRDGGVQQGYMCGLYTQPKLCNDSCSETAGEPADETQSVELFPPTDRFNGAGTRIGIQMNVYGLFYIRLWIIVGTEIKLKDVPKPQWLRLIKQVQAPDSLIDLIENSDFAYFFICVFTLICASGP